MNILGISAYYHDSAAALVINGEIIAAAQEERFTRKKHDPSFPLNAIKYCLNFSGLLLSDLDAVVFYDKPLLKFERLLETYYNFSPKGLYSFLVAIPVWMKEKVFLKKLIREELKKIEKCSIKKLLFTEHHLSHASSAFYPSPFNKAAILTIDGVGEYATASISLGEGEKICMLKELHFPHSLGLLYSSVTYYCGFRVNSGEYKLMGLAPYGNINSVQVNNFINTITTKLCNINEDGSVFLNQEYFSYATGLRMVNEKKWEKLFGFPRRKEEVAIEQNHCDLALAIQHVSEEIILKMAKEAKKLTNAEYLCLAGGVALNCVANGKIQNENIFKELFIQPAAGDAGGALGAALAAYYIYFNRKRIVNPEQDSMKGSYLGPEYAESDIIKMSRKYNANYSKFDNFEELIEKTAKLLSSGKVIGWFQGRMEFGPRALGARSILGDARNPEMQKKLNLKIKFREGFRPFAPSVMDEYKNEYFDLKSSSPYMLLVQPVKKDKQIPYPENFNTKLLMEKLYFLRSDIPSVTHIDYSARIQTVHKDTNEKYWKLINAFKKETGYGIVVNTSFNVRGEPIVCFPEDAYKCLMRTDMDYLVIGDFLFSKTDQPEWKEKKDWRNEFKLD